MLQIKTKNPVDFVTKNRGMGSKEPDTKITDAELLKFYLILIASNTIELGSAGYKRMIQIMLKVQKQELKAMRSSHQRRAQAREYNKILLNTARAYIEEYETFLGQVGAKA
jgi:hypothetical protein